MIKTTVIFCSGYLAGSVFHRQGPQYWASTCQQKPILELLEDVRLLDVTLTVLLTFMEEKIAHIHMCFQTLQ